ncbi:MULTISPECIES: potassium-transporting ATPase subunit KdpA [Corynebacterium]|uniref:potassium-transporting ATPase subunit KdpA n=1 Tax=Corynebacterium TaxID=1716 RepID=UPI0008A4D1FE|nr:MULTISPECIES: potassium-transporting ATPase subunit KdpA [Corynebacterium]MCT1442116.1 potassium-transporting ATPase subunit KdpA [Corynebacterium glucuronolyticum]MCT1563754.1 potassium-transporting ATPase subunit KdpA [Corynebacterium glucuronolyticum]OFO47941.1 potassium-transporting ATPase subunit A [Corynebacterium sp. HMSC073D01]QQU89021.1 potassium-transporting ATPase subunit KdpA [Corynebacterium glucuronolyticum]
MIHALVGVLPQFLFLGLMLAIAYVPLGDWMAKVYQSEKDWAVEKAVYAVLRVDPKRGQTWKGYSRALLAFSLASVLVLYAIQRLQTVLPSWGNPRDEAVEPYMAFNTAASFVSNTNWQSYSGEDTLTNGAQMLGLTVQNFASAAVGLCVAVALIRGLAHLGYPRDSRVGGGQPGISGGTVPQGLIGNFWVDLTRGLIRILLPLSFIVALVLIFLGTMQTFGSNVVTSLGVDIPRAPVASQEAIKLLGTNGGGIFGANSAHPFENPTAFTNVIEIWSLLVISFSMIRTYGTMVGSQKQAYTLLSVAGGIWAVMVGLVSWAQDTPVGAAARAAGANMEGIEQRLGIPASALFAVSTTGTSTGAVDSMHDSYGPLGGGLLILNMLFGEIAPGGVGTGLYGLLIVSILAVFIGGLLVGRTPEFLGNKIGKPEISAVCLYTLTMPILVLAGVGASVARWKLVEESATNFGLPGSPNNAHGLSEVLYAFVSASNNNGSAFGGLTVTDPWWQVTLGLAMLLGRFLPIVFALYLAGSVAEQKRTATTSGSLPTAGATFATLTVGVILLVAALTFFPVLTLGPISEALL